MENLDCGLQKILGVSDPDYLKEKGKSVAVVNPVGHYNDGQSRVVGPSVIFGKINKVVILTSTQSKFGEAYRFCQM